MNDLHISAAVRYVGADDTTIDLFESQYPVPAGVSYNSYVILDEKTAVLDTVDRRRMNGFPTWRNSWRDASPITWFSTTWSRTTPAAWAGCWRNIPV